MTFFEYGILMGIIERLKPKLDIFKIPENRVHELTDSNVSLKLGHVQVVL